MDTKTRKSALDYAMPADPCPHAEAGEFGLVFKLGDGMRAEISGDKLTVVLYGVAVNFYEEGGSLVTKLEQAGIKSKKAERMVDQAFARIARTMAFRAMEKQALR